MVVTSTTVINSWGFTANSLLFVCGSCVFPFAYAFNASFSFFQTIGPKCSHVLEPIAYCHCKCIQEQNHESSNFMYEERVVWETLHSKEDQSWVFFGRNDAKAETPVLWPPHVKSWLIGKRLWCWEGLGAGGEGDDRGWDGWMASLARWTWVWVNSGSWWWIGRPGMLRFTGLQRVGHDWATELNWYITIF